MKKKFKLATAAGATLALVGLTVSPAFAVDGPTLPANDKLYVVECDSTDATPLQLAGLDPVTATVTAIGSGAASETYCAYQGAQMPGSDWFYSFNSASVLFRVDLLTGATEVIGQFTIAGLPTTEPYSLTIGPDGTAYALTYSDLYTVDLATAGLTYLSSPDFYGEYSGYPYAFAYDYVTEKFYVVEDGDGALYELVPSTGDKVELSYNADYAVYSMAFDSEGNLWSNGQGDYVSKTTIADFGDSAAWQDSPDIVVGQGTLYSESIWVSPVFEPKPELPNTGVDATAIVAFGALLSIAGFSVLVARRRA